MSTLINIFRVPELRNKILFTLFLLAIYRIGYQVPLPGVDQGAFAKAMENQSGGGGFEQLAMYVSLFSGGSLHQSTLFGLGVMPYISSSIIFQLLTTVVPSLEKLQKEGESGRRKIQEWSRYVTVPLAMLQGIFWISFLKNQGLIQTAFVDSTMFWVVGVAALTTGCIFLMWLGEQIDEYGLGNGVSLIIMAGIVSQMPGAIGQIIVGFDPQGSDGSFSLGQVIALVFCFVVITAGAILLTQAQRRIPIMQAKHTRGRKVYGGQKQFLPVRLNVGGVMPIIFAQSLMLFPTMVLSAIVTRMPTEGGFLSSLRTPLAWLDNEFQSHQFPYILLEIGLIYFFAYFWTTIQFRPPEIAKQLQDYGSFIPGLRPGKRTADYLDKVVKRLTFVGAAFLALIAVVPVAIAATLKIPLQISMFLGGTGLLITISVALDMVQRIEANLLMRNYSGFLEATPGGRKRIKSRQY